MKNIIVGAKYGRLTVLENYHPENKVLCICECGKYKVARATNVYYGGTRSCGCLFKEGNNLKHGGKGKRLYIIWKSIRERCNTPSCTNYKNYGGRGIRVCEEWDQYLAFKMWAMTHGYKDYLTIDRIDVDGDYEPSNCRWATPKEQNNNKRNNRLLEFNGEIKTMSQWADITGISLKVIHCRLRRGWSVERALTEPLRKRRSIA